MQVPNNFLEPLCGTLCVGHSLAAHFQTAPCAQPSANAPGTQSSTPSSAPSALLCPLLLIPSSTIMPFPQFPIFSYSLSSPTSFHNSEFNSHLCQILLKIQSPLCLAKLPVPRAGPADTPYTRCASPTEAFQEGTVNSCPGCDLFLSHLAPGRAKEAELCPEQGRGRRTHLLLQQVPLRLADQAVPAGRHVSTFHALGDTGEQGSSLFLLWCHCFDCFFLIFGQHEPTRHLQGSKGSRIKVLRH